MAGTAITIELRGLRALRDWLGRIDPRDALPLVAAAGESVTRQRLQSGGPAPDGTPWAPWNEHYTERGQSLLHKSGALRDSIESGVAGDTAYWGSNLVYARIHQLGGVIKPKPSNPKGLLSWVDGGARWFARSVTIPARPYLGFGAAEQRAVSEAFEAWWRRSLPRGAQA